MKLTKKERLALLRRWTIGYDLDGGGYGFDWDKPRQCLSLDAGFDYLPLASICEQGHPTPDLVLIDHLGGPLPGSMVRGGSRYVLAESGTLYDTERDCTCHGKPDASEPGGWEFTGSPSGTPHPECDRCEGDGYVESPGGSYAAYVYAD